MKAYKHLANTLNAITPALGHPERLTADERIERRLIIANCLVIAREFGAELGQQPATPLDAAVAHLVKTYDVKPTAGSSTVSVIPGTVGEPATMLGHAWRVLLDHARRTANPVDESPTTL